MKNNYKNQTEELTFQLEEAINLMRMLVDGKLTVEQTKTWLDYNYPKSHEPINESQ